ncbi:hypothetical protein [Desulfonatronum parangueonense]
MKRIITITLLVLCGVSIPAMAQDVVSIYQLTASNFFVAVVAGVVLAAAFQLFLTNLSAAAGLSAAKVMTADSDDRKSKKEEKSGHGSDKNPHGPTAFSDYADGVHTTMRQVSTGFGVMTMITASISLFLATWLALAIISPLNAMYAVGVALVIWGLSYLITFMLELRIGTTMIGAIAKMARQGFQSVAQAGTQLMQRSEGRRYEDQARSITKAVHSELFGHIDLQQQIKDYINELKREASPRMFRDELENLINELRIEEYVSPDGGPGGTPEIIRQIRTSGKRMSREEAKSAASRLRDIAARTKEETHSDKPRHEKAADSALRAMGLSHEEAEQTRKKFEEFLRSTGKEQLDPDGIKRDLEKLFQDRSEGADALSRRLSSIDRDTVETLIAKRQDMSKDEVHQYVDRIWGVVENYTGKARQRTSDMQTEMQGDKFTGRTIDMDEGKTGAVSNKERILNRIEEYIASLERPNLDAEAIRHDLELMFSDPRFAAEDLYHRAKGLNRQDVLAIVTSSRYVSEEDVDKMVDQIMKIRDETVIRVERMKLEVKNRVEQARQEVIHQADEMRKTAANATWWVFITATASGVAAIFGGLLAA